MLWSWITPILESQDRTVLGMDWASVLWNTVAWSQKDCGLHQRGYYWLCHIVPSVPRTMTDAFPWLPDSLFLSCRVKPASCWQLYPMHWGVVNTAFLPTCSACWFPDRECHQPLLLGSQPVMLNTLIFLFLKKSYSFWSSTYNIYLFVLLCNMSPCSVNTYVRFFF